MLTNPVVAHLRVPRPLCDCNLHSIPVFESDLCFCSCFCFWILHFCCEFKASLLDYSVQTLTLRGGICWIIMYLPKKSTPIRSAARSDSAITPHLFPLRSLQSHSNYIFFHCKIVPSGLLIMIMEFLDKKKNWCRFLGQ